MIKRLKYFPIGLGILLILILGLGFSFLFLTKDDSPLDARDIQLPLIELSKEDNAFYDFIEAVDNLYWPGEKVELINNMLQEKKWDSVFTNELLAKNKETLFYLDKAVNNPIFQLPEFQDPNVLEIDIPLRSMGNWRNIGRLISVKALYLFKQGKEKEAFDEAIKIIKLGNLIGDAPRPNVIQIFVAWSMKEMGTERLRAMLTDAKLPAETLKLYANELVKYRVNKSGIKNIFKDDYLTIAKILNKPVGKETINPDAPFYLKLMARTPFYYKPNQTKNLFLQEARNQIKNLERNYYNEIKLPDFYIKSLIPDTLVGKIITENLIGKIIYEGMLTDRTGIFFRKYKDDFSMLGTQTLIALKIYTMENGKLPNSLTDLVPKYISEIPEDAFDGNPLRFSSTKKIIYSVGGDLKDSGGSEGDDWGKMEDPTFKIEF